MLGIEDNFVDIAALADMSVGPSLGEEGMFPGGPTYTDLTPNGYQENATFTSGSTTGYSSAPCGLPQIPDVYQNHDKHHQQHPSQQQQQFHPHQQYQQHHKGHSPPAQQQQHYSQPHNGHSHSPPAQQQQHYSQPHNGHSHSPPAQQQQHYSQPHNGHSHSPPAQQQQQQQHYSQHHNGHSHSPPAQQQQQHVQHQKQQEQQYAHPQQQHRQPPQHLPHQGDSPNSHDICSSQSTELPPPPPLSPPPTKERFSYTRYQLEVLAGIYEAVRYPNAAQKRLIAKRVGITRDQVKIWFQNRRRKDVVGVPSGGKSKTADGEGEKRAPMVPRHILSGVVNELLRYSDDGKGQGKKGKTIKGTPRPAPYNRPEPECPPTAPAGAGSTTLAALPTTSAAARLGNFSVATTGANFTSAASPHVTSAADPHVISATGPRVTSAAGPHVTSAGHHVISSTDSHSMSATRLPISGGPYTTNDIVNPSVAAHPVSAVGHSLSPPHQSSHSNHTSPHPPLVGTDHTSPHSDLGLQQNNSSIHDVHDVGRVHDDHDVSGISDVSSVNYDKDDVRRTPPVVTSSSAIGVGVSRVVAPSGVIAIPSSEQLDMVAPPNAIVPGAPTLRDGDMSGAESSPSSDDEEPEPKKKRTMAGRSPPVHVEVPPNVTLSASDPLPDLKALHSRYATHQGFYSQHHNIFNQQGHAGASHQGWRSGGGPAIHAPIPSYPAGIQPSWRADHHHHPHHPGVPLEPYLPAHKAAAAEFGLPGHHQPSYMGAFPSGGPLGQQFPPGATLPTSPASSSFQHHPAYPHGPEVASLGGRDRVLPFPLVAEPPLRLSSMAGPPPYSSPYNASYKASPHGLRSLYPDPYQPMLISNFSNPYFGLDPASWQPPPDRGNYPNL